MQPNGEIHYDHDNPLSLFDGVVFPLVWEGGPIARIDTEVLMRETRRKIMPKAGDVVMLNYWRLRVIEFEPWRRSYIVMVDGWPARYRVPLAKVHRVVRKVNARLILTAAVWGLAKWSDVVEPRWQDVYVVDWVVKQLGKASKRDG